MRDPVPRCWVQSTNTCENVVQPNPTIVGKVTVSSCRQHASRSGIPQLVPNRLTGTITAPLGNCQRPCSTHIGICEIESIPDSGREAKLRLGYSGIMAYESLVWNHSISDRLSLGYENAANAQFRRHNGSNPTPMSIPMSSPRNVSPVCHSLKPYVP